MLVIDTNVISEVMKLRMDDHVLDWFHDNSGELYLTSLTVMELNYGIMRLPKGKRRDALRKHLDSIMRDCKDRILDFDSFSGYICADLRCKAQAIGYTPQIADCMIAAICMRNNATLVTHNVKDFDYIDDLEIVDPFTYESPVLAKLKRREAERGE